MAEIVNLSQIKEALKNIDPIQAIEEGFVAYSQGKVVVPPVGEMMFKRPPGKDNLDIFSKLPIYKSLLLNYPEQVRA